jgi:hypothetical protein
MRTKKARLKNQLTEGRGFHFRTINDPQGECATLLTLIFDTADLARKFCEKIGSKPISSSGWHVYNNMEQIIGKKTGRTFNCPFCCPVYDRDIEYKKHMLPQTDDILDRAVNISVGVVDKGLGSDFGINITSSEDEIDRVAARLRQVLLEL